MHTYHYYIYSIYALHDKDVIELFNVLTTLHTDTHVHSVI